ncbi:MAG: FecR family protein [Pikeienuella sp.]
MSWLRFVALAVCASLGVSLSAQAQSAIGNVEKLVQTGYQTADGGSRNSVASGDNVFHLAELETETESWIVARFKDETSLTVAPNARVKIDDYVYRENGAGRFDLALLKGALRFTSGRMKKSRYSIFTPVAYLGIRGTDFSAEAVGNDEVRIWVVKGVVEVSPRNNPLPITLEAPVFARCDANGCDLGAAPTPPPTTPPGGGAIAYSGKVDGEGKPDYDDEGGNY